MYHAFPLADIPGYAFKFPLSAHCGPSRHLCTSVRRRRQSGPSAV